MSVEHRLAELNIQLPPAGGPAGNYAKAAQSGVLLFLSGKAPLPVNGQVPKGRLGDTYSTAQGYDLARSACLDLLATLRRVVGSLDQVDRIIEVHGSLCTSDDFEEHARVLDGASDLLIDLFGPAGLHARSVIGVYSLRGGVPLTIKATVALKPGVVAAI